MRKFDLKDPRIQRWILVPCLMVTLGSTLSWNPENTNIVRYEYGRTENIEFASNDAQLRTQRLNLSEHGAQGVTAEITYDPNATGDQVQATVRINGEAEVACPRCQTGLTRDISKDALNNMDSLRLIALSSIRVLRGDTTARPAAAPATPAAATAAAPATPARVEDEFNSDSNCEMALRENLITCHHDELMALIGICEALPGRDRTRDEDRSSRTRTREADQKKVRCYRAVESHYRKNLSKSMVRGLATGRGSQIFSEATEVRNDLISDLPTRFDDTIRQSLITMTANGILRRAQAEIDRCNLGGCAQGQGLLAARQVLENETSLLVRGSEGRNLLESLQGYAQTSDTSMDEMTSTYRRLFQTPLSQRMQAAGLNSINLSSINDPYLQESGSGRRGDRTGARVDNTRYSRGRNPRDASNPRFFNPNSAPSASGPGQIPGSHDVPGHHGGGGNFGHPSNVRPAQGNGSFTPASGGRRP